MKAEGLMFLQKNQAIDTSPKKIKANDAEKHTD